MRSRDIIIVLILLMFSATLLFTASMQLDDINKTRKKLRLVSNDPLENAPPSLAFATVAMGAFRGLLVDVLWMRAENLKQEGKFFDAKQLADWITVLQPRFAAVWDFQSWNMAYNISVAIPASQPAERWRWVRNGYELLRDRGIVENPKSIKLYHSLAWIFEHKMGGVTDDVHKYYKMQLLMAMRPLISPNTNEHFDQLSAAPKTLDELLKDKKTAEFYDRLKEADPEFAKKEDVAKNFLHLTLNPAAYPQKLQDVLEDYAYSDTIKNFMYFAQSYELRNTWKLDIDLMIWLNKKYGPTTTKDEKNRKPLNWEHPDTHAIYWAQRGLNVAGSKGVGHYVDESNTDRLIFQCLQDLYKNGKIIMYSMPVLKKGDPKLGTKDHTVMMQTIFLRPDLSMFNSVNEAWLERIAKYSKFRGSNVRPLKSGHRKMLEAATLMFYQSGHIKQASRVFAELRRLYPRDDNKMSIEAFCKKRIFDVPGGLTITRVTTRIIGVLREAYFRFAVYEDDEATGREKYANVLYNDYKAMITDEKTDRIGLPEFSRLRYFALLDFLNDPAIPNDMKQSFFNRIKIERPKLYDSLNAQREKFEKEMKEKQKKQDAK